MATRKGPSKGTGGHGRRRLEGKGPTPRAEERPGHPAQRRAKKAAKRQEPGRRDPAKRQEPGRRDPAKRQEPGRRDPAKRQDRDGAGSGRGQGRAPGGRGGGDAAGADARRRGPAARPDAGARRHGYRPVPADELVVGRNAVVEALRGGVPAVGVRVAAGVDRDDRIDEIRDLADATEVPVTEVSRAELDRLAGVAPHQGVALQVQPFGYYHLDDVLRRADEAPEPALLVALDGVSDPHNLGAVARSAAAFGGHGLLVPERRAAGVTPGAWKASAGALARLPVAKVPNLVRALRTAADAGLMIVGLDGRGELDLDDLELATGPVVVVVGAEGRGLSRLVGETCDVRVRIPMVAATESLNASVAAGVALAEVARRRRTGS